MTAEERQLIADLFDRMRQYGSPEKDRDAEALITQQVRAIPDATYMLVQSVLVQEHALREADQRMQDLEARVRELEEPPPPRREASGGSFLGGLLGGGRSEPARPSSVPPAGSRATAPDYGRPGPYGSDRDMGGPPPPAPPAPQGGGFLRSAMSTAAGVAGGVMVADTIRNMLGGGAHAGTPASGHGSNSDSILPGPGSGKSQADADRQQDEEQDQADDDAAQDAEYDDGDSDSGDDGDMDV